MNYSIPAFSTNVWKFWDSDLRGKRHFNSTFIFEKSGSVEFMVEKYGVETSGVENWGWKFRNCNVLQSSKKHYKLPKPILTKNFQWLGLPNKWTEWVIELSKKQFIGFASALMSLVAHQFGCVKFRIFFVVFLQTAHLKK